MSRYKSKRAVSWQGYQREVRVIALSGLCIFLAAALYSYNPYDSSWFYYTNTAIPCSNWCGMLGANCAALLFYICGASSFLLLPLLALVISMQMHHKTFKDEWDRVLALSVLLVVFATFSHWYNVDFWASPFPGGLLGSSVKQVIQQWFNVVGGMIFLYALFIMSVVIIMRFSCIHLITRLLYFMQRAWYQRYLGTGVDTLYRYVCAGVGSLQSITRTGGGYVRSLFEDASEQAINDDYTDILMQYTQPAENTYNEIPAVVRVPLVKPESGEQTHEAQHARHYRLPSVSLFTHVHEAGDTKSKDELESLATVLEEKLERFGIKGSVVGCKRGPVVTLFEYQPDIDAKLSKIVSLEDDLALALRAVSIRILAPIPGKSVVGFEVSNATRKSVFFSPIIQSREYEQYAGMLPLILGEDTFGSRVMVDLAKMPHLLVAGSTGSGKSVALNVMLVSLLCKRTPQELQLILIDPKRLEFAAYADIAHLIFPIVTDPKRAAPALVWVVHEMERRYTIMAQRSMRTIADYNAHASEQEKLPYIVVIIDELADLMMTAGKEVEDAIARITQMARAAGIHMIVATQRPSVDVITGVIKVNFPSRISFRVMSKIDSRTILDSAGAEKLLGRGDMLFIDGQGGSIKRVHGAYVHDADIKHIVEHIKSQQMVVYQDIVHACAVQTKAGGEIEDVLYQDVVRFLHEVDDVSISLLQRKFRIGYNRSARLIELLEMHGLIMPADGSKTRKVIR